VAMLELGNAKQEPVADASVVSGEVSVDPAGPLKS
jgi:hypothetical protein